MFVSFIFLLPTETRKISRTQSRFLVVKLYLMIVLEQGWSISLYLMILSMLILVLRSNFICPSNWCCNWHCREKQWSISCSCHYCWWTGYYFSDPFFLLIMCFFLLSSFLIVYQNLVHASYNRLPGLLINYLEGWVHKNRQL